MNCTSNSIRNQNINAASEDTKKRFPSDHHVLLFWMCQEEIPYHGIRIDIVCGPPDKGFREIL
jgi:hypothetical protein